MALLLRMAVHQSAVSIRVAVNTTSKLKTQTTAQTQELFAVTVVTLAQEVREYFRNYSAGKFYHYKKKSDLRHKICSLA